MVEQWSSKPLVWVQFLSSSLICIFMLLVNYKVVFINFFENLFNIKTIKVLDLKKIIIINNDIFIKQGGVYTYYGSKENYILFLKKYNTLQNKNKLQSHNYLLETGLLNIYIYITKNYLNSLTFRFTYRLKQTNWGFYYNINNNKKL